MASPGRGRVASVGRWRVASARRGSFFVALPLPRGVLVRAIVNAWRVVVLECVISIDRIQIVMTRWLL